jgi:hypothetical protein
MQPTCFLCSGGECASSGRQHASGAPSAVRSICNSHVTGHHDQLPSAATLQEPAPGGLPGCEHEAAHADITYGITALHGKWLAGAVNDQGLPTWLVHVTRVQGVLVAVLP